MYEKSQRDCSGCLSLPHFPLLPPPMLLPSIMNAESGSGNEKALPKRDLCNFPASPSTAASPSPSPLPQFSLADGSKGPLVLAGCCWLPGRLSQSACQAFQGSFSLSRGWKCRAGDRLPWQPHCFQTLKGRERKVCFSRLTKATTIMDAGQVHLKITAVLPDTPASRGQSGTMRPRAAGMEQGRAEGELGAFSSIPPLT